MDPKVTRRDFLNGVSIAVGASLLPGCGKTGEPVANAALAYYPPAATGMRGSHPGSFEVAHATVQGEHWATETSGEHYDLVVVGAGISGLSAAHIYRRDVDPDARILILDNHDDFGGHAKRNEFTLAGRTMIGFGGTMLIEAPASYPEVASQVLREVGIDAGRYAEFQREDWVASLGLGRVNFFDKETFGEDYIAAGYDDDALPLSDAAKEQFLRLFKDEQNYLADLTPRERRRVLETHSWREYLATFAGMGEEVLSFVQKLPHGVWAIGADAFPAWLARDEGYPGFADMDLGDDHEQQEP